MCLQLIKESMSVSLQFEVGKKESAYFKSYYSSSSMFETDENVGKKYRLSF